MQLSPVYSQCQSALLQPRHAAGTPGTARCWDLRVLLILQLPATSACSPKHPHQVSDKAVDNRYGRWLQSCDKVHLAEPEQTSRGPYLTTNGIWTLYGNPLLFTSHLLSVTTVFAPVPSSAVCSGRLCTLPVGKSFYTCWSSLLERH